MSRRVTINIGFITNSSSCVYYFPKEVLEDPQVKAFIEAYDLGEGYLGSNLWSRSACASFLVTREQKADAKDILRSYDYEEVGADEETRASQAIDPNDEGVYVLYGDEYSDTTHVLCGVLSQALSRLRGSTSKHPREGYVTDYN